MGTRHGASLQGGVFGWGFMIIGIFCGDAPWHVPTGLGFWMGFMIIGIFYGTMCTSSQYLMEYCDFEMGFLLQWNLKINICGGRAMARPYRGEIKKRRRNIVSTSYPYLSII